MPQARLAEADSQQSSVTMADVVDPLRWSGSIPLLSGIRRSSQVLGVEAAIEVATSFGPNARPSGRARYGGHRRPRGGARWGSG